MRTAGSGVRLERYAFTAPVMEPLTFTMVGRMLESGCVLGHRSTTSRGPGRYPASANSCSIFRIGYTRRRGSSGRLAKPSRA